MTFHHRTARLASIPRQTGMSHPSRYHGRDGQRRSPTTGTDPATRDDHQPNPGPSSNQREWTMAIHLPTDRINDVPRSTGTDRPKRFRHTTQRSPNSGDRPSEAVLSTVQPKGPRQAGTDPEVDNSGPPEATPAPGIPAAAARPSAEWKRGNGPAAVAGGPRSR